MANPSVSVVVPVYNSEHTLPRLIERLVPVLEALGGPYEVVLVNDASADRSWEVIAGLGRLYPFVRGVCLTRNFGQHNALLCGIRAARHELTVTLDDDLQNPPEEIPGLVRLLLDGGHDVVYGTPQKGAHGLLRNLASVVTKWALQHAMGSETARRVSAFRIFRTHLRQAFAGYSSPYVSIDVLLSWATTRFAAAPVRLDERAVGESNYTLGKLVRHAVNMMTGFSAVPLRFATLVGIGFAAVGFAMLLWVLGAYLVNGVVAPGFTFLACMVAIFSGAQLFALGIIGEYLARVHFRVMDKPPYVVRAATDEAPAEGRRAA